MKEEKDMFDRYFDLTVLLDFLNKIHGQTQDVPITKVSLNEAVLKWMNTADGVSILQCKDCNTYSTAGIQDKYGWCKKFCFGPENTFFCLMAAPWEEDNT